jgi:hypothetical protein
MTAAKPTAPGLKVVKAPSACATADRRIAGDNGSTQARGDALVPATGETAILLCRYNGMKNPPPLNDPLAKPFGLLAHAQVTNTAAIDRFVAALNRVTAVKKGTAYPCPADFGADEIAYFEMGNGTAYRYAIDTTGCNVITSGTVWRFGLDARFIGRMERLTPRPRYGTVAGKLVICTSTNGRCKAVKPAADICDPVCSGHEAIALRTKTGTTVTTVMVNRRHRFIAHVAAGRYRVVPITVPGKGVQPMTQHSTRFKVVWVTVRDGRRAHVTVYVHRSPVRFGQG